MPDQPTHVVGIDLGTSNSAVCCARLDQALHHGHFTLEDVPVSQLVDAGEVRARPVLPSVLYFPPPHLIERGGMGPPWDPDREVIVGELARRLGAGDPGRMVTSAKSWLSHSGVDRTASVLPWAASEGVERISAVEAQASYLAHIAEGWDRSRHERDAGPLEQQRVVLAVPASFDPVARELTLRAASEAGLDNVVLVEEPQAAFHEWLGSTPNEACPELEDSATVLVCDVGGGTTDFTLILLSRKQGRLLPKRVAVGDHLLLGGDNIDLALAHRIEPHLSGRGGSLSATGWAELVSACREAKEALLDEDGPPSHTLSVLGEGSSVVGGVRSTSLSREVVDEVVLEGFFPLCSPGDSPCGTEGVGLREWGLPYESDPAVTRHLAAFLRSAALAAQEGDESVVHLSREGLVVPDAVLFNGGVFGARPLRSRILDALHAWNDAGTRSPSPMGFELTTRRPDLAVARGAVRAGMASLGVGVKIRGGAPRSYYIGAGGGPGRGRRIETAICVLPRGAEPGEVYQVRETGLALTLGRVVHFPLYSSRTRIGDTPGGRVNPEEAGLVSLPPLATALTAGGEDTAQKTVPVILEACVQETGALDLYCRDPRVPGRDWRLTFELRPAGAQTPAPPRPGDAGDAGDASPSEPPGPIGGLDAALDLIDASFSRSYFKKATPGPDPRSLRARLEESLATPRAYWSTHALRTLADQLLQCAEGRKLSAEHETRWLNLTGFCLRPGRGYPLDERRLKDLFKLFSRGVIHTASEPTCIEWWILWRRVAAGLDGAAQEVIFAALEPHLLAGRGRGRRGGTARSAVGVRREMWRTAASLERLDPAVKVSLGQRAFEVQSGSADRLEWLLSRLGARVMLCGDVSRVVPVPAASDWAQRLIRRLRKDPKQAGFALAHVARKTADRSRDLPEGLRRQVIDRMTACGASPRHVELVESVVDLAESETAALLGDQVPPGLILLGEPSGREPPAAGD